jgi:hypothetical protein
MHKLLTLVCVFMLSSAVWIGTASSDEASELFPTDTTCLIAGNDDSEPGRSASPEPDDIQEARRSCCSWHGGVCGCNDSAGRLLCCDGSLSPSCGC